MPALSRRAASTGISCIVEQLGLATMPSWAAASASLTPATTSGTPGSMRHCEELSTTTAPRATASGAKTLEAPPPAEKMAMSTPSKAAGVVVRTGHERPPNSTLRSPSWEASGRSSPTGKSRSARMAIMVRPTRPVAPTTATVRGLRGDSMGMSNFLWGFVRGHGPMIAPPARSPASDCATVVVDHAADDGGRAPR